MFVMYSCIIIIVGFFFNNGGAQKKLPFPHLTEFNETDIGKPYFIYDGVDYETLPQELYIEEYRTCNEEYARCTRLQLYSNPVCGYHTYQNRLWGYYTLCELDLSSCYDMKRRGIDMYGKTYRQRGVYFMGEGNRCELYLRRIAEGEVPRDIRDVPKDLKTNVYDLVTGAMDLQQDNFTPNSEYDY